MRSHSKILVSLLLAAPLALASLPAAAQKLGTIRSSELVQQSPQFKAGQDKMKAEFERRANDLEAEAKKLAEDIKNFQKAADLLAGPERAKQEKDLNTRKIDFEYKSRQFQEERQNRERQLFQDMMVRIKTVIEQVARERSLEVVIENPVFSTPAIDVTDEVLKRLQATPAK